MTDHPVFYYPSRMQELRDLASNLGGVTETLALRVLDNPLFEQCSGSVSSGKHHYGDGGLLQHTWEVVKIALSNRAACGIENDVPATHAFLAALYHDVGKIYDYTYDGHGGWNATEHKRLINHMNRSALMWAEAATQEGCSREFTDSILHAILSHHAEHGSSVMPKTKLAWLLHLSDQLSVWMDQCDRRDPAS